jgi:hypothetical protein
METTKEERDSTAAVALWKLRPLPRAPEDHCPVPVGDKSEVEMQLALIRDVDRLEAALLDARERIDRWDQLWLGILYGAVYDLAGAKESANGARREVDCKHEWGPLPEWDNEYEPWEHCANCKVNRPARAALAPPTEQRG